MRIKFLLVLGFKINITSYNFHVIVFSHVGEWNNHLAMLYSYILCRNYSSKINWLSKGIPLFLLKRKGGDFNSKIIIRSDPLISMHQSLLQLFTRTTIFHWRNCWSRQVVVVRRILYRWRRLASKACFLTPLRAKVTRLGENNFVTLSSCFLARLLVVRKMKT